MRALFRAMLPAIAVAVGLLSAPTAALAATTACVPVTIDGVDVACVSVDFTQVQQPSGETTTTATLTVTVDGQTLPPVVIPVTVPSVTVCEATGVTTIPGQPDYFFFVNVGVKVNGVCTGVAVALNNTIPSVGTTTVTVPYHVPEICVTTTGTCVGPFDRSIPVQVPTGVVGTETVCVATDSGGPGSLEPLLCVPLF